MSEKQSLHKWKLLETALWGYSTVLLFVLLIFTVLPSSSGGYNSPDGLSAVGINGPILLFFLLTVIHRKAYLWNWWKVTLTIYALILVFLFIASSFVSSVAISTSSSDAIGSALLFLPIFIFLLIRGNERLA